MSLREEIQKDFPWLCKEEIRDIVKIFEKRIDELLKQVPTISSQDMYSTSNLATERRTLNKVKEMLK